MMKILYVEDNPIDADMTRRWLRRHAPHLTLETVETQSDAIARLTKQESPNYDLILTDLRLPDGDGLSLLTYIRERGLPFAVVVITGTGDEETAVTALKAGADDYVSKRGEYLERLPLTLENALRHHRAQSARHARTLKALYAERHDTDIDLTLRHLQRYAPHIQLDVARTGAEALQRLPQAGEASRYDVILLDYRLPGLNGLEVLKELRQDRALDIPVVLVTGQGDEEVALQALKLGAASYLVKNPGYLHQLTVELENACYRAEILREQSALKQSEERLRLAQRAARIGTWDWNIVTGESNWSEGIYELLGLAPVDGRANVEDFVGSIHPEDREPALDKVESVIRHGEEYYDEFRVVRRDGAIAWLSSKGRVIRDVSGNAERMIGVNIDITDRKRAEVRLRSYFELPLIGMAITSPDRRFVEVNQKLCDILGYSMDQLTGMSWVDVTHPDDVAENIRLLDETLRGATEGYVMDKRFIHRDGHIVYTSISARCVRRGDRTVDYLALVVQDITERRRAEQALRESEERFRSAFDHATIGMALVATDGRFLQVNRSVCELLGYSEQELLATDFQSLTHPDDLDANLAYMRQILVGATRAFQMEKRYIHKRGHTIWALLSVSLLRDGDGQPLYFISQIQDITERKQGEEALRESEARFRNLADNAPVIVWMSEPDGACSYLSQSWYEFTGLTPDAGLGFGWVAFLHPDDRELSEKTFQAAKEKREAFRLEYRLRRNDGEYRWVIDSARPRFGMEGELLGYIGSVVDITETKQAELNTQFINQLDFELSQIADADEIIRLATSRLGEYLGATSCYVIEVNPAADLAIVHESWHGWRHDGKSIVGEYRISDFVTPEFRENLEAGHAAIVNDVATDPRTRDFAAEYEAFGVGAFMSIPALNERQWEASLNVNHPRARDWRPDETQLMRDIAARLWPAVKRARAVEALRDSEQRFRQLAENIGATFFITEGFSETPPGQILYVSPAYEKIWGRSCESLYQDTRSWLEAVHPEDNERVLASLRSVGRAHFDEEFRIIRPDGEVRWIHDRVFPIRDERGEIYRLAGIVEDITERKQFEEALRESEQRYRSVVESQTELICRYLPDTTLTFVNEPYCRYFGKTQEELVGTKFLNLIPESAREIARKHIESLVESPRVEIDEHEVLLPDGRIGWQQWVDHAILDANGKVIEFQAVGRDITERKQVEEERREGEERLRLALEAGRMGVWEWDTGTNSVKWSKEHFTVMGLAPFSIEPEYHSWADRVHPDDLPLATEMMRRAIEGKGEYRCEYRIIWPDGSVRWVEGRGKPVYDEGGRCLKMSGLIVDISERKQAEDRLMESEAQLRLLTELIPQHVWTAIPDNKADYRNQRWLDYTGMTIEEVHHKGWMAALHPDDHEPVFNAIREASAQKRIYEVEARLRRADGQYRWFLARAIPQFDQEGNIIKWYGTNTDIEDRKQAEEALRLSEDKFSKAFRSSPDAFAIGRPADGMILEVNERWEEITGYSREEAVGRTVWELQIYPNPDERERLISLVREQGSVRDFEVDLRKKTGEIRNVLISAEPIMIRDEPCLMLIVRDITERKRADLRLNIQYAISRILSEAPSVAHAASRLLQAICESLSWELGEIWLVDREANHLTCLEIWSQPSSELAEFASASRQFTFPPDVGLPGRIWKNRRPTWITDIVNHSDFPRASLAHRAGLHSGFGFPALLGDEAVGVMVLFSREVREPDENLLRMMASVGSQIGQFIERKQAEGSLRESEEALRKSYAQIEDLAGRLIAAQEEERRHIARELHDDLNQQVAALAIGISRLKRQLPNANSAVQEQIARLQEKTDWLSERIRQVSHELHSSILQHVGLHAALNSYCEEFSDREGIAVSLDIGDSVDALSPDAALCLYRVAQESLRNIARHSGARSAIVALAGVNDAIELRVTDQGVGFDPGQAREGRGLGLVSMEERVKLLNGSFVLTTRPGAGTELIAQIPLRREHEQTKGTVG